MVHNLKCTFEFDLGGPTQPRAVAVRDELLDLLQTKNDEDGYGVSYKGLRIYTVAGKRIRIDFSSWGSEQTEDWRAFTGLTERMVILRESSNDHFPRAGLYDARTVKTHGIGGASATVRWQLDHKYCLQEDSLRAEALRTVGNALSSGQDLRIEAPVTQIRSWSLTLTAPTLKRAEKAYGLLRGGIWTPETPFIDALPDPQKIRLLRQQYETGINKR